MLLKKARGVFPHSSLFGSGAIEREPSVLCFSLLEMVVLLEEDQPSLVILSQLKSLEDVVTEVHRFCHATPVAILVLLLHASLLLLSGSSTGPRRQFVHRQCDWQGVHA